MRTILLLLATCIVAALGLSYALFPREHEIALMNFRDEEYAKALRYYRSRLDAGETSITVVMPLIETYRQLGQTDQAVGVLERYVQSNPADLEALTLLVQLCKDAMFPIKYAHYLAMLNEVAPSGEKRLELANIYDFEQNYDQEIVLLEQRMQETGEGASRLIPALASLGRKDAAISLALREAANRAPMDASAKYVAFRLLTDMQRASEATQLAEGWLRDEADTSPSLASFAEWLLQRKQANYALQLITRQQTDLVNAAEDVRGLYVRSLRETKKLDELRAFWRQRLAANNLTEEEESAIMYGLLDLGDREQALSLLRKRAIAKRGDWIFAYVENAVKAHREKELLGYLESEFSRSDLTVADLQQTAEVVLHSSPATLALFLKVRAEKDPKTWANIYAEALQQSKQRDVLVAYMDRILASGRLSEASQDQWLHRLIDEGGLAKALPHVRRMARGDDGADWRSFYISTLRQLNRPEELRAYLIETAHDDALALEQRRGLASEMLRENMKKPALELLMSLAEGSSPDDSPVRELRFLWGPRLDPTALAWVDRQLANAPIESREGWLRLLLETNAAGHVIEWYERPGRSADGMPVSLYIEALAANGQSEKLVRELARVIDAQRDPAVLRHYASLAADAGDIRLAERAWAALLAFAPKDPAALRARGLILFSQQRYGEAELHLRAYLDARSTDYEANYAYAEVLTNLGRREEARTHYEYTLELIAGLRDKPYGARLAETICLQRLGHKEQAVSSFEKMLQMYPDQRGLRADYASVLLENNATEMAKSVLGMR